MGSHGEAAVVPLVGLAVVMLHPAVRRDVLLPALEHLLRRAQRRAPLPLVHRARVAGVGHGVRAAGEIGADEEGVAVLVGDVGLAVREREAALHEALVLDCQHQQAAASGQSERAEG